jgi:NSS family neurotransmitter:Na+ symporter
MEQREKLGSRLGFILLSAGCAIGIGNVWKFPYITGQYGGAFVVLYLFFLAAFGVPLVTMEFAIGREHALCGEAFRVAALDTFVAVASGLIIFPACSAFGVSADSGPQLIFITLPNIFNHMAGGRLWGSLFFLFMAFAALSTVIAVFENILSCCMDLTGCGRKRAAAVNTVLMILLSLPCALGFNLLSGFQPLGVGSSAMDLEDFLVSNVILPLGSLIYLLFCVSRRGWGLDAFLREANTGRGLKLAKGLRVYMTWVLPAVILLIFLLGMKEAFS